MVSGAPYATRLGFRGSRASEQRDSLAACLRRRSRGCVQGICEARVALPLCDAELDVDPVFPALKNNRGGNFGGRYFGGVSGGACSPGLARPRGRGGMFLADGRGALDWSRRLRPPPHRPRRRRGRALRLPHWKEPDGLQLDHEAPPAVSSPKTRPGASWRDCGLRTAPPRDQLGEARLRV